MRRPTRTDLGYALLLSVPPGVGATVFGVNLAGAAPAVLAFGVLLTAGLFLLVLAAAATGAPDRQARP